MFTSPEDAWNGAVLATKNARNLFDSACLLRERGHSGCASALFVLCAEESSKAIGIGQHISKPLSLENLKLLFRNHAFKHEGAAHSSSVAHLAVGLFQDEPAEGKLRHGECGVLDEIAQWRTNADSLKKRGFYVDYVDGQWVSPVHVTEQEQKVAGFVAQTLLTLAEGFFLKGTLTELRSHTEPK